MQRRHSIRHLAWRTGVAAVTSAAMVTGAYPLVPIALRAYQKRPVGTLRTALTEWGLSVALQAWRPTGFFPLPGARQHGPRPVILVHGYAMSRAGFAPLAFRLARAGLGPILGFEYWTLGRTAAAARQLSWFVEHVQSVTGSPQVDVIGHSLGGLVSRYYVQLLGGDGAVANLVTLGSPHVGTGVADFGIGHPAREMMFGSTLLQRLAAAPPPQDTRMITFFSNADPLVPAHTQPAHVIPHAERIVYDDLGHNGLLGSGRIARDIIQRLK